jgi:hypothetical protein
MNFASYRVVAIHDNAVELWDGESKIEPNHPAPATMICPVGNPYAFQVDDVVDLVVVLRERPEVQE